MEESGAAACVMIDRDEVLVRADKPIGSIEMGEQKLGLEIGLQSLKPNLRFARKVFWIALEVDDLERAVGTLL